MSLVLKNVSKTFAGKKVVDNVSLALEKPGVYGLLGTNGAGKTTTIRMLLGIINKDSGENNGKDQITEIYCRCGTYVAQSRRGRNRKR